jgi:hypothetical protein
MLRFRPVQGIAIVRPIAGMLAAINRPSSRACSALPSSEPAHIRSEGLTTSCMSFARASSLSQVKKHSAFSRANSIERSWTVLNAGNAARLDEATSAFVVKSSN